MKKHSLVLPAAEGGSTPRTLIPSGLCLSALSRVVWAWPDPLPTRLKRVGKNVPTLWWAELDRLHSMTRAHPPLAPLEKGLAHFGTILEIADFALPENRTTNQISAM